MIRLALAVVMVVGGVAGAQPRSLGNEAHLTPGISPPSVELVTFGVGARIFEKFGHAALCLRYPDEPLVHPPVCFNYGVTDFADGTGMVWRFLRTEQRFWVEPDALVDMFDFYEWEDRDIWVQPLPLTDAQAREIERKLLFDLAEPNRYYFYDHFRDNCTTRLRDMIDRATGGKLSAGTQGEYPLTFRELGVRGLAELPPLQVLTDFVIGRSLDAHPTRWEAMFHPAVMRAEIALAFGVPAQQVYARTGPPFPSRDTDFGWRYVAVALAALFSLPIAIAQLRRRGERVARVFAALYLGGWGILVWALAIVSSIPALRWNEVALVLVPFDLLLPFFGRRYARARVVMLLLASALCAIGVLKQPLWVPIMTAFLPLAIIARSAGSPPPARPPAAY